MGVSAVALAILPPYIVQCVRSGFPPWPQRALPVTQRLAADGPSGRLSVTRPFVSLPSFLVDEQSSLWNLDTVPVLDAKKTAIFPSLWLALMFL